MKDIAAQIHHGLYGCSDKANAPVNQSDEWQAGYAAAMANTIEGCDLITIEWKRRGFPRADDPNFREWKRGMWAATMQKLLSRAPE